MGVIKYLQVLGWSSKYYPEDLPFFFPVTKFFWEGVPPSSHAGNIHMSGDVRTIPVRKKEKKAYVFFCLRYGCQPKNRGFSPQIIHFNRVFHYFHHPFWGFSPYFWKHPYCCGGCGSRKFIFLGGKKRAAKIQKHIQKQIEDWQLYKYSMGTWRWQEYNKDS